MYRAKLVGRTCFAAFASKEASSATEEVIRGVIKLQLPCITCSSKPEKNMSNSTAVIWYVQHSYMPCSFQVMCDEEQRKEKKKEREEKNKIKIFAFVVLNFEKDMRTWGELLQ